MRRLLQPATTVLLALCMLCFSAAANVQTRMSDKDVENTMKNLSNDAKSLRTIFDHAVSNSTIRKTSQEKRAKALSKSFVDQTQDRLHQFQNSKKVDSSLPLILRGGKGN